MSELHRRSGMMGLLIPIILIIVLSIGGYAYYKGSQSNPDGSFLDKITGGVAQVIDLGGETNYTFSLSGAINSRYISTKIDLDNGEIYSSADAMKQKFSIGSGMIDLTSLNDNSKLEFGDVGIISDTFKTYLRYNPKDELGSTIASIFAPFYKTSDISVEAEKLGTGQYLMVDNKAIITNILGNLAKNEAIKELVLSTILANPYGYLEKNNTYDKIKKQLEKDTFLDFMFKQGAETTVDNKQKFVLVPNSDMCATFIPLLTNLQKISTDIDTRDIPTLEQCQRGVTDAADVFTQNVQAYKLGDIQAGNYDVIFVFGNNLNIKANYKNHILDDWSIDASEGKIFNLHIDGKKTDIHNSLLTVNYIDGTNTVKGEVKNGNGQIDISVYGVIGTIELEKYYVKNLNINAMNMAILTGYILENDVKLDFDLENNPFLPIHGIAGFEVKKDYLSVNAQGFISTRPILDASIIYDAGKVDGKLVSEQVNVSLTGTVKSLTDINLKLIDTQQSDRNFSIFEAKRQGGTVKYIAELTLQGEKVAAFTADLKKGDSYYSLKGSATNLEDTSANVNFDFMLNYKKGGVKFEIPTNIISLDTNNIYNLITFSTPLNPNVINKQMEQSGHLIVAGVVGGLIGGGLAGFFMVPGLSVPINSLEATEIYDNSGDGFYEGDDIGDDDIIK